VGSNLNFWYYDHNDFPFQQAITFYCFYSIVGSKRRKKKKKKKKKKKPKKHIKTCYEIHSYSIVGTGNATGIKKHIFVGLVNSQETFAR